MDCLVILITGASGGIGRATALHLAYPNPSYKVKAIALHYNSNDVSSLIDQIKKINPSIEVGAYKADLLDSDSVASMHSDIVKSLGPITVLFSNAGTSLGASGPVTGTLDNVSLEIFEKTWRINTLAPYQLTQLVVPGMVAAKFGRVVYNSSVAAINGGVVGPHYASSKSALHGMLHHLAIRHAKDGITFNAVAPALIEDTRMIPHGTEEMKSKIPVGRVGKPEEIANVVGLMVENGYVCNKVWVVDGGWIAM